MPTSPAFGRRATSQGSTAPRREFPASVETGVLATVPVPVVSAPATELPSLDDELRAWKENRKSGFEIPWQQIYLMASLCFGLASLVLTDTVNDAVDWLLYGLMAASFVAGISRRRKRKAAVDTRPSVFAD
jgi:hypothetical protein